MSKQKIVTANQKHKDRLFCAIFGCEENKKYLVFYNGTKDMPERKKYRLSDAFLQKEKTSGFEWTATMLNINAGHNRTLMKKCKALKEYADFIQNVRDFHEQSGKLDWAINEAVKQAEQRKCLGEFFRKNRAEVYHLVLTEYDEELHAKTLKEEGRETNIIQLVCIKMLKGKAVPEIADALETDEETIAEIYEVAKKQMPDYDVDAIYEELHREW